MLNKMRAASRSSWLIPLAITIVPIAPAAAQLPWAVRGEQAGESPAGDDGGSGNGRETAIPNQAAAGQMRVTSSQQPYQPPTIMTTDRTPTTRSVEQVLEDDAAGPRRIAKPSEFELFASEIADKLVRRFGSNLLVPGGRDFTAPPTTTVPQDYRINPGDQLRIGLTGAAEGDLRVTVDSEGRVFIPRIGAIRVGGLRYGDLQSVVATQVARQYRNFRIQVAIDQLHGITVYVTGFAVTPGSYTVSSLSTLVNAVLAAGGPSAGGSFRSVQLRRNGVLISDFDLYDFLLKGDKSADAVLQNGDVITIAPVGAQAAIIGSVNNEAVFEARPNETLTDLLIYAGGVNTAGDLSRLLVLDPLDLQTGWQVLTPAQSAGRIARRAQILRVLSDLGIARPLERQGVLVTLSGEVARPGRYFLAPGTPISDAIQQAGGLTKNAYVYGAIFTRDTLRAQQRASYERAIRSVDYLLAVAPLTSAFTTDSGTTRVAQLRDVVTKLRDQHPDGRLILDVTADATALPSMLSLQNNDNLYIPPRPVAIGVFGSVPSPSSLQYSPGMTIGDYLRKAGGVQKIGDKAQMFVIRANGSVLAPRHGLFAGSITNEPALPGDLIYVPINPMRGEIWRKISSLLAGLTPAAALIALSQ